MRYDPGEEYASAGEGRCWEMFHPELRYGPYCHESVDHEGDHLGFGMRWADEPKVPATTAERFLRAYRRIPNNDHEIYLNDDGTVRMTMRSLEAAVTFIGLNMHGDD